jgi:hypothetical protein
MVHAFNLQPCFVCICVVVPPSSSLHTIIGIRLFRFKLEVIPARCHGVAIGMLLSTAFALRAIDAEVGNANDVAICGTGADQGFHHIHILLGQEEGLSISLTSSSSELGSTLRYGGAYPGNLELQCFDTDGYADSFGYPCSQNAGYNCLDHDVFKPSGYSQDQLETVAANCSESCGLCGLYGRMESYNYPGATTGGEVANEGGSYDAMQGHMQVGGGIVAVKTASTSGEGSSGTVSVRSCESLGRKSGDVLIYARGSESHTGDVILATGTAGGYGTVVHVSGGAVLAERESKTTLVTAATVGRDSVDVSLVMGVAGGDESGSIVAVVLEGSRCDSVIICAGDGRGAGGRGAEGEDMWMPTYTAGSGNMQLSSGEGGSVTVVTSGDGQATGSLRFQPGDSASLEGSSISAALESGARLGGVFGGSALRTTRPEESAGDRLELTGDDSALSNGGQVRIGDHVLETIKLSASASVASGSVAIISDDSQSNEHGDVRIYWGQGITGGTNVVVSRGSGGEDEHRGSVEVESAHGGHVSVGSGSSEASGDVMVTTGDGSERSGDMDGGAAGAGKMGTLVLGATEGSADTGGDGSLSCGLMAFLKEVMAQRAEEKAKKGGKDTTTSVAASPVCALDHALLDDIETWSLAETGEAGDPLMGDVCTGTGVSNAKDVSESESWGIVPSMTSAGVVANVPRREGIVGPINKAKGRGFIEYNTVNEQTPINADIERFVHTISVFAVLLGISFFIIGYAIHSTVANVLEGLLLIGRMLTFKRKRMLTTNLDANSCDKMGSLTPYTLMNGTASSTPSFCFVLLCSSPHHLCNNN